MWLLLTQIRSVATTFLSSTQSDLMLTIHTDVFQRSWWYCTGAYPTLKTPSFPAFPGHIAHAGSNAASAFPSWAQLDAGAEAGNGCCAGHPPLPWSLKDDLGRMQLSSLMTTYLACLMQLLYLLFPKGAKIGEGDAGRRCLLCKLPCPALP